MKKKISKTLRHTAEDRTIGQHPIDTRKLYRRLKKEWNNMIELKKKPAPKFTISKRQQRKNAA